MKRKFAAYNDSAIHGIGATANAAIADAHRNCGPSHTGEEFDFDTAELTFGLLADVERGNCQSWSAHDGVLCTDRAGRRIAERAAAEARRIADGNAVSIKPLQDERDRLGAKATASRLAHAGAVSKIAALKAEIERIESALPELAKAEAGDKKLYDRAAARHSAGVVALREAKANGPVWRRARSGRVVRVTDGHNTMALHTAIERQIWSLA
jgi:hypothetical protein